MPAVASPYFDDPAMGQIAQNMYLAINGDPHARAQAQLYASEVQKNQALAGLTNSQRNRLDMSNTQLGVLPDIFSAERGTMTPGSTTPYDADPNNITEGDVSTGGTFRPPTGDELARLQARELTAYMGESKNPEEAAKARLAITAQPFLTSSNPSLQRQGANIMQHPLKADEVVNYDEVVEHDQRASDAKARETGIKGQYDLAGKRIEAGASITRERISQAAQTARETGKPVSIPAAGIVVVPKGHYAWTEKNQGVLYGLPTKAVVEGAAGTDIAAHGQNPTNTYLYDSAGSRPGRGGKGFRLPEAELAKGELNALQLVPGATTSTNGKTLTTKAFMDALGPDRQMAGRAAYDDAITADPRNPAAAQRAYLDAAGLHGASYDGGYFGFGAGIKGGTDQAAPAQQPPQQQQPATGGAPAVRITHDAAGVAAYNALPNGAHYIDPNGVPKTKVGPTAPAATAAPAAQPAAPVTQNAQDYDHTQQPGDKPLVTLFGHTLVSRPPTPEAPQPATAQVFAPPEFASEDDAKKALGGPRDAAARQRLGMVDAPAKPEALPDFKRMTPTEITRFIGNPGTSDAARHAATAYQAQRPPEAAVVDTRPAAPKLVKDQQTASFILTHPKQFSPDEVAQARTFFAHAYGG